eukprot:1144113-Pelagomonas_calceolata.AAC.11
MEIWRVRGSTQLHNLAVRSMIVFNSTPSGNKLVGIHNRMGMKLASKFNGTLMVKSKLFELIKGVFNTTGPANTQKKIVWRVTVFALMSLQRSACFRCAASNCSPGLVSSQKRRCIGSKEL